MRRSDGAGWGRGQGMVSGEGEGALQHLSWSRKSRYEREECQGWVSKGHPEGGECGATITDFSGANTEPYHSSFSRNTWNISSVLDVFF